MYVCVYVYECECVLRCFRLDFGVHGDYMDDDIFAKYRRASTHTRRRIRAEVEGFPMQAATTSKT